MYCWEMPVHLFPLSPSLPSLLPPLIPRRESILNTTALGYFFLSNLKITRSCVWLFVHESLLPSEHPPAVGGTFSTLEAEVPVDEGFFLNTHLELPTFLWESSYYLKDGLCLSLPPPDEAVNRNKRIWLNKFPIQTLSCGQRTL